MEHSAADLEDATWAEAEGRASDAQLALLAVNPAGHQRTLEGLLDDTKDKLESARRRPGVERELAVPDLEADLDDLQRAFRRLNGFAEPEEVSLDTEPPGEVRLQASWASGQVVLWAGGPGVAPAGVDELVERLDAAGGPTAGRQSHPGVPVPTGGRADALSVPVAEALGWLVSAGAGDGVGEGVGASVRWLGQVAIAAVRLVARGAVVPSLSHGKAGPDGLAELSVRWLPALLDEAEITELAEAMPGTVTALGPSPGRPVTLAVLRSVLDAIVSRAAGMLEVPAPPPTTRTAAEVAEAVVTRLDGSAFRAPVSAAGEVSTRLQRWSRAVTVQNRPQLVVQLDPPDRGDAWLLSVWARAKGSPRPIEEAMAEQSATSRQLANELARVQRLLPALQRPGRGRGQVFLSQPEAWKLMTETGPAVEAAGFEVRVPALSRRTPSPALRLFTEPAGDSVVGAHQLADVRWSVVFDDVELTAAEVARLAAEARPLVRSRGRWVALDRADLKEAAAALAERAGTTKLTGAEILRHAVGLETSPFGRISIDGSGWATDLLKAAEAVDAEAVTTPEGFVGQLRHYQAEALGWLGFLDAVGLSGCLALDMGLGKTPTVLAHLARTAGDGAALVVAPPAVVGNWAAEAARFTPGLRVVVHHGASRASADELEAEIAGADIVITTYGTAVRDVEALAQHHWRRVVLDEAQAIKNAANETTQQLRRISAAGKLALTGTPIENGLGDLWSILDWANPGLLGARATFVAQLAGEGEAALRALNGILVFRRTKAEPSVAAELPDKIDELDHCTMTSEQIGLYQAVLDRLISQTSGSGASGAGDEPRKGAVLAAITALKQICNHPAAYEDDGRPLAGRSGKLARLEEIVEAVFAAGERLLIFTHFAEWGRRLAVYLSELTGQEIACYDGSLARGARDRIVAHFQQGTGAGALVLSLKAGGTGLNLTAASHVVLYDRWWNPAVEDQARDRAWRIGQTRTVVSHRLVCPGTVDERVEEVVAGKRHIADLVLPKSSSLSDLDAAQLRVALGLRPDQVLTEDSA